MRVLYIDDKEEDRVLGEIAFQGSGMELTCVDNVDDGFAMLQDQPYGLVICDMMMPGDDGLSFAKEISDLDTDTRFILTSGVPALREFNDYHGLQNYLGFILKPITPQKVMGLL